MPNMYILKHYTVTLLVDLNADLKHYFSVRHSVAPLEPPPAPLKSSDMLALYKLDYYYYYYYYYQ